MSGVLEDVIGGLIKAKDKLESGGVDLPNLPYEEASELITLLTGATRRPISIFWISGKNRLILNWRKILLSRLFVI